MTTTQPTCTFSKIENLTDRLTELYLLIELACCGIDQDLFTGKERETKVAALNRIADRVQGSA